MTDAALAHLLAPAPMSAAQIFFSFKGRVPRRVWWLCGVGAMLGLGLLFTALLRIAGVSAFRTEIAVNALLLWPALAVSVKRWHDRDRHGAYVLVNLIPVVGWLWVLVENGLLRGTPGANRYGEDLTEQF